MSRNLRRSNLVSVAAAVSLFSVGALGCECAAPPPPCEAVGGSQLVFLGTVTEVNAQPGSFMTARMKIDRVFKGDLKKTIELYDDGMCDGPHLEIGKQYLMYTWGSPNGMVPARGCTRSRAVEDADEDLEFLKQYSAGKVATHVDGTVRLRPDEPTDSPDETDLTPLKDVLVTLARDGKHFRVTTNSIGGYSFSKLPPGTYTIDAELPGFYLDWAPAKVALNPNGCFQANLLMTVDRRVQGIVRDEDGAPADSVLVQMVPTRQMKPWERPVLLDISDENGHYTIAGIPPGDYYVGVNVGSTPTKEYPYAPTYFPDTPDRQQAIAIDVPIGASIQEFDLRAPRKLPLVTVRGRVQTADGKPPSPQDHPYVRIKEPGLYGQIEEDEIKIDADGRFQVELCDGIEYSAFAFSGRPGSETYSAPVEFTPTKGNDQLVLTLSKTMEEFLKLHRQLASQFYEK